jgi:hypothetical protein
MKFLKYEFTPTQWATAKAKIQKTVTSLDGITEKVWDTELVTAVVELGKLCTEWSTDPEGMQVCVKHSSKISVDILWAGEPLTTNFAAYVVWPDPCGVHIFAGWESEYQAEFCQVNPDAPCCQPPAPVEL